LPFFPDRVVVLHQHGLLIHKNKFGEPSWVFCENIIRRLVRVLNFTGGLYSHKKEDINPKKIWGPLPVAF
jgi:hypothetical protein